MVSASSISSRQHPAVKRCRQLARHRDAGDPVLLDGEHLVVEADRAGLPLELLLVSGPPRPALESAARHAAACHDASASVIEAASPVRTPSGVVALARWSPARLDALFETPGLVVGLVGVQDPGNLGAVIRSVHALGGAGVAALDGTADPAGWKALRGAMGSTFHVPVARGRAEEAIALARTHGFEVLAATAAGGEDARAHRFGPATLLLLGNEGAGLPDALLEAADGRIRMPMRPGVDSLNVAVTASLLVYEAGRGQDRTS